MKEIDIIGREGRIAIEEGTIHGFNTKAKVVYPLEIYIFDRDRENFCLIRIEEERIEINARCIDIYGDKETKEVYVLNITPYY